MITINDIQAAKTEEDFKQLIKTPEDLSRVIFYFKTRSPQDNPLIGLPSKRKYGMMSPLFSGLISFIQLFAGEEFMDECELEERKVFTTRQLEEQFGPDWQNLIKEVL